MNRKPPRVDDLEAAERALLDALTTRRHGDVGFVLAETWQGTHDGPPYSMSFRYTDVWVLESAEWRLAIRHASAGAAPSTTAV
jgi:ketosteroid isomerase-like protein